MDQYPNNSSSEGQSPPPLPSTRSPPSGYPSSRVSPAPHSPYLRSPSAPPPTSFSPRYFLQSQGSALHPTDSPQGVKSPENYNHRMLSTRMRPHTVPPLSGFLSPIRGFPFQGFDLGSTPVPTTAVVPSPSELNRTNIPSGRRQEQPEQDTLTAQSSLLTASCSIVKYSPESQDPIFEEINYRATVDPTLAYDFLDFVGNSPMGVWMLTEPPESLKELYYNQLVVGIVTSPFTYGVIVEKVVLRFSTRGTFPWTITVKNDLGVTVGDVVRELARTLNKQLTDDELKIMQEMVQQRRTPLPETWKLYEGTQRIDCLGAYTRFRGLSFQDIELRPACAREPRTSPDAMKEPDTSGLAATCCLVLHTAVHNNLYENRQIMDEGTVGPGPDFSPS
ncbi:unnamed protein product [Somion occarium]|uniref:DUF6699 domain-containing protein n=1 Tax=Somion occarium TaxID=3059160 RepID=A0ABP1CTB3_9APHY